MRVFFSGLASRISGRLGPLEFSHCRGVDFARFPPVRTDLQSGDQMLQRFVFKSALSLWMSIRDWAEDPWALVTPLRRQTPANYARGRIMDVLRPQMVAGGQGEHPAWDNWDYTVCTPHNPDYPPIDCRVHGPHYPGYCQVPFYAMEGGTEHDKERCLIREIGTPQWTLDGFCDHDADLYTFDGLDSGTRYEICMISFNDLTLAHGASLHRIHLIPY